MRPDASQKLAAAAPKQGPNKALIGGIVALIVAAIIGGALWYSNRDDSKAVQPAGSLPAGAIAGGKGLQVYEKESAKASKTVDIYEDFQCPFCKQLETKQGAKLLDQAKNGKIKLRYHIMTFLDDNLGNDASARAANAAFCAANAGVFPKYHSTVFANQPEKEGQGYTDQQLVDWGKTAGMDDAHEKAFKSCYSNKTYSAYVKQTEEQSGRDGITSTPGMKINGKQVSEQDLAGLMSLSGSSPLTLDQVLAKY